MNSKGREQKEVIMCLWLFLIYMTLTNGCAQVAAQETHHDHEFREGSGMVSVEVKTPALTRIEEFHGHIGPYVVLGYKMGLMARDILGSPGYFDMTVDVQSPLTPPASCLIDGIQLGSGCTTGKRNLTVAGGLIGRGIFRNKKGASVLLSLRADVPEKVRQWIEEIGVEKSGRRILGLSTEEFIERIDGVAAF